MVDAGWDADGVHVRAPGKINVFMRVGAVMEDGYHVKPPKGYVGYPQREPGYVASSDLDYIPVAGLILDEQ